MQLFKPTRNSSYGAVVINGVLFEIGLEDAADIRIRNILSANFEQDNPGRADPSLSKTSRLLHKSVGETYLRTRHSAFR